MLANNRFFGTTAATGVSGLAPSPNALPFFQILARRSGGYGKTVSAPRGYGAGGLAWPARAGELSSDVDATITLGASGTLVLGRLIDGQASITLDASGAVAAVASVAGSASVNLTASATLQGQASASGSANITLGAAATLTATAALAGQASITLGAAGTLGATADIAGIAYLSAAAEGGLLTTEGIATAVRTELQAELLRVIELAKIHGLVIGSDLVVTPTSRSAGAVQQSITDASGTTTVARLP